MNCSWISTNTPKHLILFGFYDVSLTQEARHSLLLLRIGQHISYHHFIPTHTIVMTLENRPLDQTQADMEYWLCVLSAYVLMCVSAVQMGGSQGFLWREVSKASVPTCSSCDTFPPTT